MTIIFQCTVVAMLNSFELFYFLRLRCFTVSFDSMSVERKIALYLTASSQLLLICFSNVSVKARLLQKNVVRRVKCEINQSFQFTVCHMCENLLSSYLTLRFSRTSECVARISSFLRNSNRLCRLLFSSYLHKYSVGVSSSRLRPTG